MNIWTPARERTPNGLTVLSGTAELASEFVYLIEAGNAVEFSTMTTHGIGAHGKRPVTILTILTQDGQRAHG